METTNDIEERWERLMPRRVLVATGAFYLLFGTMLIFLPPGRITIARNALEALARSQYTQEGIGGAVAVAGLMTLISSVWYRNIKLRIAAAAIRSGSMGALELLVTLVWLFLHQSSPIGMVVFGYLFILSLLTLPPPHDKHIVDTLRQMERERGEE